MSYHESEVYTTIKNFFSVLNHSFINNVVKNVQVRLIISPVVLHFFDSCVSTVDVCKFCVSTVDALCYCVSTVDA